MFVLQNKLQSVFAAVLIGVLCLILCELPAKTPADYDSEIEYAIEINKPDTTIARMYMEYQYFIYISDVNKAIDYLKKAEQIYTKNKDYVNLAAVLSRLGQLYHQLQLYDIALGYLTQAHGLHAKYGDYAAYGYTNCDIANVFFAFKQYDLAESYYRQSLKLFLLNKDSYGQSVMLNNIGLCKIEIHQPDSALYYFKKGYELRLQKQDKFEVLHSINYLAVAYNAQKRYDLAVSMYNDVINGVKNWQNAPEYAVQLMADAQYNLHETYYKTGSPLAAKKYLSDALLSYKKIDDTSGMIKVLLVQADAEFSNKNYIKAEEYAIEAEVKAQEMGLFTQSQKAVNILTRIYLNNGNSAKAQKYFLEYSALSDSILNQYKTSGISQTHAAIQSFYKDREYQSLKDKDGLMLKYFTIIAILLVALTTLFVYVLLTRRNSINRLKQFANATFEAILIHNKSIIMEVNDQLCKQTGYSREELINKDYRDVNLVKLSEGTKKAIRGVEIAHYEGILVHKDGTEIEVEVMSRPFPYRNKMMRVVAIRDITERKKYINELLEINRQNHELIATKDKLFSIIAHDLRNPFNAIINFSNMLKKDIKAFNDEELMEVISMIHDSSQFAHNLLSNLLDWARIQTGALSLKVKKMLLATQVNYVLDIINGSAANKQITIKTDIEKNCHVYADVHMLRTVLLNLLSNAVKFTPAEGVIALVAKQEEQFTIIEISDSGMGISVERIATLFDPESTKSTQGTNKEQGTGLGLMICHELISKHGGTIEVQSIEGSGTTFVIKLPIPDSDNA
jgi:PAS domain S-box-containing protein